MGRGGSGGFGGGRASSWSAGGGAEELGGWGIVGLQQVWSDATREQGPWNREGAS